MPHAGASAPSAAARPHVSPRVVAYGKHVFADNKKWLMSRLLDTYGYTFSIPQFKSGTPRERGRNDGSTYGLSNCH